MAGRGGDGSGRKIGADEAAELEKARDRMIARHKLIEAMIRNNELQLKNESARGGAEIERACALRDAASLDASETVRAEVDILTRRVRALEEEHERLVSEREWLNISLLEFDNGQSADTHAKAGHA